MIFVLQLPQAGAEKVFTTDTLIEAENATLNNGLIPYISKSASNGMLVYNYNSDVNKAEQIKAEDINFRFSVNQEGKYHIYMRCNLPGSTGRYFYRLDDGEWTYQSNATDGFEWIELTYTDLTVGVHRLSWNHSAINSDIDAFYITMEEKGYPDTLPGVTQETEDEGENDLKNVLSMQKKEVTVTGNGVFFEAEDATYCEPYTLVKNKLASGGNALQAKGDNRNSGKADARGTLEFTFTPDKDGTYVAWARALASNGGSDSFFGAFLGQSNAYVGIAEPYGEFVWTKIIAKQLKAGEKATVRILHREKNAIIDAFIVTPTTFTPTGRTGNIPEGEVKTVLKSEFEPTPVKPPTEHPRVLFTKADIPKIKANMESEENQGAVRKLNSYLENPVDGSEYGSYNTDYLANIEAFAFDYAINGNSENGKIAVDAILNYIDGLDITGNFTRNGGHVMYVSSEVYDWCYDLLTTSQKAKIISICESIAAKTEIEWPPIRQGSVVGHGSEAQLLRDMLCFAIATYNERPDIWEYVGGRFYEEYVPARNYFNKGHYNLQGDSYGLYRHRWDNWSHFLIKGMGAPDPYNSKDLASVGYGHIYKRRPDGQYMRDGDTYLDTSYIMWEYWSSFAWSYMMDSAIGNDPYLKDEAIAQNSGLTGFFESSPVMFLIVNNPDIKSASVSNLPKSKYFADPVGMMIARTGWERGAASNDVVAEMKIGGVRVNNHQHFDAGHFQIYYKGILASDSGVYQGMYNTTDAGGTGYNSQHNISYMTRTIAHNSMLVYDPEETTGQGNRQDVADGGQRAAGNAGEAWSIDSILNDMDEWRAATVESHEIDPENPVDPYYSYIKGDIADAYTDKVQDFKRSFMFLNLFEDEVPAALVVFDKVTSANPTFKKTWLLHGLEEPTNNGNQTIFARTYKSPITPNEYNGKMTVDTLLPKAEDAFIDIIGGEEDGFSNVNGVDYTGYPSANVLDEGNTWRMELSPKGKNTTDYFLNVIQVSDNDKEYYLKPEILETNDFYGAAIKDRAVFFSKSGKRVEKDFTLELPNSNLKVTVCDTKAGKWTVNTSDGTKTVIASEEGGVLAFEAKGRVSFHYEGEAEAVQREEVTLGTDNYISLRIKWQLVVCPEMPEFRNDKVMVPLSTLVSWLNMEQTEDEHGIHIKTHIASATIKEGSSMLITESDTIDMGVEVYKKNNELMVPVRAVTELFGGTVAWKAPGRMVDIELPPVDYSLPEGYAVIKSVTHDTGEVDGENVAENVSDGNADTIWAANGVGRYIDIELDRVYTLDRTEVLFNPNGGRSAAFEVQISEDGLTYTTVIDSVSDGSLEDIAWECYDFKAPVKVKYLRYVGNGSNISNWNAIKEIRFREKK